MEVPRCCDRTERADGATGCSRALGVGRTDSNPEEGARAGAVWGLRETGTRGVTTAGSPGPAGPSGQLLSCGVMMMPPVLQSTRGGGRQPPAPEELVWFMSLQTSLSYFLIFS